MPEKSGGRSSTRTGGTWSHATLLLTAAVWLQGMGIDMAQFMSDVQLLGLGQAVMRLMFGISTSLRHPSP